MERNTTTKSTGKLDHYTPLKHRSTVNYSYYLVCICYTLSNVYTVRENHQFPETLISRIFDRFSFKYVLRYFETVFKSLLLSEKLTKVSSLWTMRERFVYRNFLKASNTPMWLWFL